MSWRTSSAFPTWPRSIGAAAHCGPWMTALIHDLQQHRGSSLVLAGDAQPPEVHALAHAINRRFGNSGRLSRTTNPVQAHAVNQTNSLRELVDDLNAGRVEATLILRRKSAYTAPADLGFASAIF